MSIGAMARLVLVCLAAAGVADVAAGAASSNGGFGMLQRRDVGL